MKIIVRSTSPVHGLVNLDGNFLPPLRPAVALLTSLLQNRIAKGDFRLLVGNLDDSATDVEFLKYLADSKGEDPEASEKLAIDSFESTYSVEALRRKGVEDDLTAEEKELKAKALQDAAKAEKKGDDAAAAAALLTAAGNAVVEPGLAEAAAGSQDSTTTQTPVVTEAATTPAKGSQNTPTPASNKR